MLWKSSHPPGAGVSKDFLKSWTGALKHFCDLTCRRLLLCVARSVCPAVCRASSYSSYSSLDESIAQSVLQHVTKCPLGHLDSTSTVNLAGMQVPAAVSKQLCFPAHIISVLTA